MTGPEPISVEKIRARALRRLVFWRLVTTLLDLPRRVALVLSVLFEEIARVLDGLSSWAFYYELDAATVYRNLTDLDLAHANGEGQRYAGVFEGDDDGDVGLSD